MNKTMRKIEFLEQTQETLLGLKKRENREEEQQQKLVYTVFLFTFPIREKVKSESQKPTLNSLSTI